jgi:hypothetical protein
VGPWFHSVLIGTPELNRGPLAPEPSGGDGVREP